MTVAVTRAEGNLLTLARVAVGIVPPIDAMRLLVAPVTPPSRLGPTAREVLTDTLARGTVLSLARSGGWVDRSWQRITPPLEFTPNIIRVFSWLLSTPLSEADVAPLVLPAPPTPAEDALVAMLIDRLRGSGCDVAISSQLEFRRWPLTTIAHAAFLARNVPRDEGTTIDVATLAPWLESLRTLLARSWLAAERSKRDIVAVDAISRMGRAQHVVLNSLLDALHAANRHDLATFLIEVGVSFLSKPRTADELTRSMGSDAPFRERTEARRAAVSTWRALATLRVWDQQHRNVRFIEDDYELSQRLVRDWERLGERGFNAAASLVQSVDALS